MKVIKYPRIEGAVKLSSFIKPMLAESSLKPAFSDSNWIFEIKWDGYRAIAEVHKSKETTNRLYSRNGTSFNKAFQKIYVEMYRLPKCIIDGEIVCFDDNGKPCFNSIQNYNSKSRTPIQFQVFDILELEGKDLRNKKLIERKEILKSIIPASEIIRYCDHVAEDGELLFEHIVKLDLEGMIAKKADSKYYDGTRAKNWLKIKNHKFNDFVVIGYLHSESNSYFKSLVLADSVNGSLTYRGHVSGFSDKASKQILAMLEPIKTKPVSKHEKFDAPVTWVNPQLKVNVRYTEITGDGVLRHPVFESLVKG